MIRLQDPTPEGARERIAAGPFRMGALRCCFRSNWGRFAALHGKQSV